MLNFLPFSKFNISKTIRARKTMFSSFWRSRRSLEGPAIGRDPERNPAAQVPRSRDEKACTDFEVKILENVSIKMKCLSYWEPFGLRSIVWLKTSKIYRAVFGERFPPFSTQKIFDRAFFKNRAPGRPAIKTVRRGRQTTSARKIWAKSDRRLQSYSRS